MSQKYGAKVSATLKSDARAVDRDPSIVNKSGSDRVVWISAATTLAVEGVSGGAIPLFQIFKLDRSIRRFM